MWCEGDQDIEEVTVIREFFAPRVFLLFIVLWAILWSATIVYIRATKTDRKRFIRHATAPFVSGATTLVVVILFIAALTFFN